MNARRVLTLDQVAEQLQIKPSWLRTQCENRQVPFTMLGGSYRFTEKHVEQIIHHFEKQPRTRPTRTPAPKNVTRLKPKTPYRLRKVT